MITVYELSKEIGKSVTETLELCREIGVDADVSQHELTDQQANRIRTFAGTPPSPAQAMAGADEAAETAGTAGERPTPRPRWTVVAVAVLGLAVAGGLVLWVLGGDDDGDIEKVGSGDFPTSVNAEDRELAERSVLRLEDFPLGWSEEVGEDEGETDDALDEEFERCAGAAGLFDGALDDPERDGAEAESPDFTMDDTRFANSNAGVGATEGEAKTAFDLMSSDEAWECMRGPLAEDFATDVGDPAAGVTVGELTVEVTAFHSSADEGAVIRMVLPVFRDDQELSVNTDFVLVRVGRVLAMFVFVEVPDRFPMSLEEALVGKVVARMDS